MFAEPSKYNYLCIFHPVLYEKLKLFYSIYHGINNIIFNITFMIYFNIVVCISLLNGNTNWFIMDIVLNYVFGVNELPINNDKVKL